MNPLVVGLRGNRGWDGWGLLASSLCVAHCIATPFLALALPALAAAEGVTHRVLGVAVLLFALLAFVPGTRVHGDRRVPALGAAGVALIWTALLLPEDSAGDALRDGLTVLGGLVMVSAHVFNVVLCRRCAVCCGTGAGEGSACDGARSST